MKILHLMLGSILISFVFIGCAGNQPTVEQLSVWEKECDDLKKTKENDFHYVFAQGECLEYLTYDGLKKDEITILIHGSWEEGSDPIGTRFGDIAQRLELETGITSIALATPGLSSSTSNRYKDMNWGGGNVVPANESFVQIIVEAIEKLKKKYHAKKVNIYGKSSGAMLGGIISGYKPGLLDKVILLGGAYDVYYTYNYNKWGKLKGGLISAEDFVEQVDKKTSFLLIAGTEDKKAPPIFAMRYKEELQEAGLNAQTYVLEIEHSGMESNEDVLNKSIKFLKN